VSSRASLGFGCFHCFISRPELYPLRDH
jgi:hypothetical protein